MTRLVIMSSLGKIWNTRGKTDSVHRNRVTLTKHTSFIPERNHKYGILTEIFFRKFLKKV
jgi:hypothetical protein